MLCVLLHLICSSFLPNHLFTVKVFLSLLAHIMHSTWPKMLRESMDMLLTPLCWEREKKTPTVKLFSPVVSQDKSVSRVSCNHNPRSFV